MKKRNDFIFISILLLTSIFFFACPQWPQEDNGKVYLNVRVSPETLTNSRSIVPQVSFDDVYFTVTAKEAGGSELIYPESGSPDSSGCYTFALEAGKTYELSAFGCNVNNDKDIFKSKEGERITVRKNGNYGYTLKLYYIKDEGKGSVKIYYKNSTSGAKKIKTMSVAGLPSSVTPVNNLSFEGESWLDFYNVTPGDYNCTFKFYGGSTEEEYLFSIHQTINVRSNVSTDTLIDSGEIYIQKASDDKNYLTFTNSIVDNYLRTQLYVKGSGGSLLREASDDTETPGTWAQPFASLKAAVERINSINDGETTYSIYIDGMLSHEDTALAGKSDNSVDLKLEIYGLNNDKKKDGIDSSENTGKKALLFYGKNLATSSLTLGNLTLKNFNTPNEDKEGSVIYCNGAVLTMNDCLFEENTSACTSAGAVYVKGVIEASDCTFKKNTVNPSGWGNGGAVYITQYNSSTQESNFTDCLFEENWAISPNEAVDYDHGTGGAVYVGAPVKFDGCTFKNNHAKNCGGALGGMSQVSVKLKNCTFDGNYIDRPSVSPSGGTTAKTFGAAVAFKKSPLHFEGKIIAQTNYIKVSESEKKSDNISLTEEDSTIYFSDTFSKDSRIGIKYNGSIYYLSPAFCFTKNFTYYCPAGSPATIFTSDDGYNLGWASENHNEAALCIHTGSVQIGVYDSLEFEHRKYFGKKDYNNTFTASCKIGEVYVNPESMKIEVFKGGVRQLVYDSFQFSFPENLADDFYDIFITAVYNGAEYKSGTTVYYGNHSIVSNADDLSIAITEAQSCDSYRIFISNDLTLSSGFVIENVKNLTICNEPGKLNSEGYIKLSSTYDIQTFKVINSTLSLENLNLSNTSAGSGTVGKAVKVESGSLTMKNCKVNGFKQNSDGIVHIDSGNGLFENCTFEENTISSNVAWGGAIRGCGRTSIIIKSSEISNNTGAHMGAGVYSDGRLEIYDSKITGNTAQRSAGVFYHGNYFYMENTEVSSNKATSASYYKNAAGGIWIENAKKAVIKSCTFTSNETGGYNGSSSLSGIDKEMGGGGAMVIKDSQVQLYNCTFTSNKALRTDNGGAILIVSSSSEIQTSLTTSDCNFGIDDTTYNKGAKVHPVDGPVADVHSDYFCMYYPDRASCGAIMVNGSQKSDMYTGTF